MTYRRRRKPLFKLNLIFNKRAIIILILIFTLFIAFKAVNTYSELTESAVKKTITVQSEESLLIKQEGLEKTLIIIEGDDYKIDAVWQIVNNVDTAETVVFYIPSWVYFEDHSESFVDYISIRDFLYTGLSIDKELGHEYTIWQVQNLTGISSDSYVWLDKKFVERYSSIFGYEKNEENINSGTMIDIIDRYSFLAILDHSGEVSQLKESIQSNMEDLELLAGLRALSNLFSYNEMEIIDLSEEWALTEVSNRNGEVVSLVNTVALDSRIDNIGDIIRSSEIEKELVEIEVYNGSGISGIAGRYARRFQNGGVDVIRYDNSPIDYEESTIYIPDASRFKSSLSLIIELMVIDTKIIYDRPDFMTTGDIVIVLGEDIESAGMIVK